LLSSSTCSLRLLLLLLLGLMLLLAAGGSSSSDGVVVENGKCSSASTLYHCPLVCDDESNTAAAAANNAGGINVTDCLDCDGYLSTDTQHHICFRRQLFQTKNSNPNDFDDHYHYLWNDLVGAVVWFVMAGVATACGVGGACAVFICVCVCVYTVCSVFFVVFSWISSFSSDLT